MMGLDMYAYVASKAETNWDDSSRQEIAYWRKHPNLHGWMEKLWNSKGQPGVDHSNPNPMNDGPMFNGIELELTWDDIDMLEKDIKRNKLKKLNTKGFFFGNPSDDYYRETDLKFCVNAKAECFLGRKVFYNSSW